MLHVNVLTVVGAIFTSCAINAIFTYHDVCFEILFSSCFAQKPSYRDVVMEAKVGGKYCDQQKALEIANIAVERLRKGDGLEEVKSMVATWQHFSVTWKQI